MKSSAHNPYVVVKVAQQEKRQTKTIRNTRKPEWNELITFGTTQFGVRLGSVLSGELLLEVFDESPGKREAYPNSKKDTLLGRASVDLEPLRTRERYEWRLSVGAAAGLKWRSHLRRFERRAPRPRRGPLAR